MLKEAFDEKISRKVMQYYWHKLINNPMNKLMLTEVSREDLHRKLTETFSNTPQRVIDTTLGMFDRLNTQGALGYKEELKKRHSRSKWYKDQIQIVEFLEKNNIKINSDLLEFVESAVYQKPLQLGLPI